MSELALDCHNELVGTKGGVNRYSCRLACSNGRIASPIEGE